MANVQKPEAQNPKPGTEKVFAPVTETPRMNNTERGGKYVNANGVVCDANGKPIASDG
jgi:hypothetical protein